MVDKSVKNRKVPLNLTVEEARLIHSIHLEYNRRGGFLRIFPSVESWKLYSGLLGKLFLLSVKVN